MKKIKMAQVVGLADEKYVAESAPKASGKGIFWRKFALIAACVSIIATSLCLWLFMPLDRGDDLPEEVDKASLPKALRDYEDSEYLDLMYAFYRYEKENTYGAKNNFEKYIEDLFDFAFNGGAAVEDAVVEFPTNAAPGDMLESADEEVKVETMGDGSYVETTDNQVAGVIEADLFKRTKTHIFYLNKNASMVYAYSIKGEESSLVSSITIDDYDYDTFEKIVVSEMFLSQDGKTLTLLGYSRTDKALLAEGLAPYRRSAILVSLDVSDPANITEKARFAITGDYTTARVVDGKILLVSNYTPNRTDFSDVNTLVPLIDCGEGFTPIAAEDIVLPESITSKYYNVVTQLNESDLKFEGAIACLSYSNTVYVSSDKIFLTRQYSDYIKGEENGTPVVKNTTMTEIYALGYGADGFKKLGGTSVEGRVKNQYSLDEYEGVLRVVTTLPGTTKYYGDVKLDKDGSIWYKDKEATVSFTQSNAALYCIDLASWQIVGEVRDFAPDGETVESVRFDGTNAYVCTAVVITFTDPVYFFDLSDMSNITYTDTGVIDGYSSSLVNFGDGFLLGIGYGATRDSLKIEVYYENGDKVESIASYEREGVSFSEDYKSYFIDRERGLIGLSVSCWNAKEYGDHYILLMFDGYKLTEVLDEYIGELYDPASARATLADDYFYIMENKYFKAVKLYN